VVTFGITLRIESSDACKDARFRAPPLCPKSSCRALYARDAGFQDVVVVSRYPGERRRIVQYVHRGRLLAAGLRKHHKHKHLLYFADSISEVVRASGRRNGRRSIHLYGHTRRKGSLCGLVVAVGRRPGHTLPCFDWTLPILDSRTRSSAQSRITHRHSKHNRVARTLSTPISTDDGEDCFERRASPRTTNTLRTASRTWFERVASATGEEIGTLHARGRCMDSSGTTPAPSILSRPPPHVRALIGKSRSWTPLRNRESTPSVGARHRKHSSESSRTSSSSAQSSTDDIADCFQQRAPSSSRSTKSPPSSRRASLTWFERVASATGEDMGTLHARGRCVDSSDTTAAHSIRPRAPHVRALIGKSQSWTPPRNRESAPTPDATRQSPKQSLAKSVAARRLQAQYTSLQHSVSAGDLEACSPSTRRTKLDQELECRTIDRALHRACVSRNARSPPPDPTNNNGVIILDASSPLGVFVRMLLVIFAVVASVFCRLTPHTHKNARLQPLVSMEASADELVALVQDLNAAKTRVANERMHKVQGLARQLHAISLAEGHLPQRPIHRTKSY